MPARCSTTQGLAALWSAFLLPARNPALGASPWAGCLGYPAAARDHHNITTSPSSTAVLFPPLRVFSYILRNEEWLHQGVLSTRIPPAIPAADGARLVDQGPGGFLFLLASGIFFLRASVGASYFVGEPGGWCAPPPLGARLSRALRRERHPPAPALARGRQRGATHADGVRHRPSALGGDRGGAVRARWFQFNRADRGFALKPVP